MQIFKASILIEEYPRLFMFKSVQNLFAAAVLAGAVFAAIPASAAPTVNEDFEGVTPPTLPSGWAGDNGAGRTTATAIDSSELFGQGANNQYLLMQDDTTGANYQGYVSISIADGDVFTINFLAVETEAAGGDIDNGAFGLGTSLTSSSNRSYDFSDAALNADRGELHEIFVLINNSGSAEPFLNPVTGLSDSIGALEMRVFAYNYVDTDYTEISATARTGKTLTQSTRFGYTVSSARSNRMNIDDFQTVDGLVATIPEPASLLLIGLGGLCMIGRTRARQPR